MFQNIFAYYFYMEKETSSESLESPSMMTYVIGAILVVAVIAGALYFRSKNPTATTEPITQVPVATPTPGPITGLLCDKQYFNQKIGFQEYYLSVEGGDLTTAKTVTCDMTATVKDKIVASASAESPLSAAPQRNGSTFRCTSKAIALTPNVPTVVDVALTDDLGKAATCTATFTFPQ